MQPSSPLSHYTVRIALLLLSSLTFVASNIVAQPGLPEPFEVVEKRYEPTLQALSQQIASNPRDTMSYLRRAETYRILFDSARTHKRDSLTFASLALADLSKGIEISPSTDFYNNRARWYQTLWYAERPTGRVNPGDVVDYYLANQHFKAARSDWLSSERLDGSADNLLNIYRDLAQLHLARGVGLGKRVFIEEIQARGIRYLLWGDFDTAIEYYKKTLAHARKRRDAERYLRQSVADTYAAKGLAAYQLGDLDLAVESYQAGEKYFDSNLYFNVCSYYNEWADVYLKKGMGAEAAEVLSKGLNASALNCRILIEKRGDAYVASGDLLKAVDDYTSRIDEIGDAGAEFWIKRAKVYLDLHVPQKALDDLNRVIGHYRLGACPQPFLLRAQVHRRLGNSEEANADEKKAEKLLVDKENGLIKACDDI